MNNSQVTYQYNVTEDIKLIVGYRQCVDSFILYMDGVTL